MFFGDGWQVQVGTDSMRDCDFLRIYRKTGLSGMQREVLCSDGKIITVNANDELPPETKWSFPTEALSSLMDALWKRGLRPKDRRHEEEAELLRESLERSNKLFDLVLPRALRKES